MGNKIKAVILSLLAANLAVLIIGLVQLGILIEKVRDVEALTAQTILMQGYVSEEDYRVLYVEMREHHDIHIVNGEICDKR